MKGVSNDVIWCSISHTKELKTWCFSNQKTVLFSQDSSSLKEVLLRGKLSIQ